MTGLVGLGLWGGGLARQIGSVGVAGYQSGPKESKREKKKKRAASKSRAAK